MRSETTAFSPSRGAAYYTGPKLEAPDERFHPDPELLDKEDWPAHSIILLRPGTRSCVALHAIPVDQLRRVVDQPTARCMIWST